MSELNSIFREGLLRFLYFEIHVMRLSLPFSLGGICNRDALSCVVREVVLPKKIKNYFL